MSASFLRNFTVIAACSIILLSQGVYAQEEPGSIVPESQIIIPDTPDPNPITEAERALRLGENPAPASANPVSFWSILRVLLTLVVVAAAIYGLVFLLKRTSKGDTGKDPFLKILARTQLGVNRSVYVLSVGPNAWLVGAAENGVNLIAEITDKETLDAMFLEESRKSAESPAGRFLDFKSLLGKLGINSETGTPGPENIRKRSERLKGL